MLNRIFLVLALIQIILLSESCVNNNNEFNLLAGSEISYNYTSSGDKIHSVSIIFPEVQDVYGKYLFIKAYYKMFDIVLNSIDTIFYNEIEVPKLPFEDVRIFNEKDFNFRLLSLNVKKLSSVTLIFTTPRNKKKAKLDLVSLVNEKGFNTYFLDYPAYVNSNFPVIKIESNHSITEIKDEATVYVYSNSNESKEASSHSPDYKGKCTLKIRGNTSKEFRKKGFKLELTDSIERNISLLGMPKEHDWVLHGPYKDISLIRNKFAYDMAMDIGYYAARTEFCELIINNEYLGIYLLTEKIKADKNRVNIMKNELSKDTIESYIIKIDKGKGIIFRSDYKSKIDSGWSQYFYSVYPSYNQITKKQRQIIFREINDFEQSLLAKGSLYMDKINLESFVDYFIIQELTRNIDAYRLSTFIHKYKDGKLNMGPVWDFNYSLGITNYNDGYKFEGWVYQSKAVPFWWEKLLEKNEFKTLLINRWFDLRKDIVCLDSINRRIDDLVFGIDPDAMDRNFVRWNVFNEKLWVRQVAVSSYDEEIEYIKNWLKNRIIWIDENIKELP